MEIMVESTAWVVQCSLALQWRGTEYGINTFFLSPLDEAGAVTFRSYTVTDEGFSLYEYFYSFRDGNWYQDVTYSGRDCDGSYSSEKAFRWNGSGWEKLGNSRQRDYTAESMGY
jgi:hypothetical protein